MARVKREYDEDKESMIRVRREYGEGEESVWRG